MNKAEFLLKLREKLSELPKEDIINSLEYYSEIIDDRIEEGLSEESAVEAMGSIDEIVSHIYMDTSLPKLVKAKVKPKHKLRMWEIILLILGSPIWLSVVLVLVAVVMTVYIVLWSAVIALYAANLSFAVCTLGGVLGGIILASTGYTIQGILFIGAGIFSLGISMLMFFGINQITKGVVFLSKIVLQIIKSCFIRKEN